MIRRGRAGQAHNLIKYTYVGDILYLIWRSVMPGIWGKQVKKYGVYETLMDAMEVFKYSGRAS